MESYGGHYGPALVPFFDQQSALIQQGKLQGEPIDVGALMIDKLRRSFLSLAPAPVLIPQLAADGVTHSSKIRSTSTSPLTHRDMANSNQTLFLQTLNNYTQGYQRFSSSPGPHQQPVHIQDPTHASAYTSPFQHSQPPIPPQYQTGVNAHSMVPQQQHPL